MEKNTKAALIFVITFVAAGIAISSNTFIGYALLPVVTYFGGSLFSYVKTGKWDWKPGVFWGVLGLAFSVFGALS